MRFPFDIPAGREFDAVGFGTNAVEHLVVVPAFPAFDTKTRLVEHAQTAGGQTPGALVALARLGARTAYCGRFGSDEEGRFGLRALRDEGVDVERAEVIEGARTQVAYVIIDARTGARTVIRDTDARLTHRADEIPADFAARARVLHLDTHDPPSRAALAREARAAGTVVSAAADAYDEGLPELLPHLDLLVASPEFARRLTGIDEERAALSALDTRLRADALVVVTRGARGALLRHEGRFVECPAFTVPGGCRDTTGARDAFHAGFLHAMLRGEDVETSLRTGCAVAALKCRRLGARAGLPTPRELSELLASVPAHEAKR